MDHLFFVNIQLWMREHIELVSAPVKQTLQLLTFNGDFVITFYRAIFERDGQKDKWRVIQ